MAKDWNPRAISVCTVIGVSFLISYVKAMIFSFKVMAFLSGMIVTVFKEEKWSATRRIY